jgi:hypothetical protein
LPLEFFSSHPQPGRPGDELYFDLLFDGVGDFGGPVLEGFVLGTFEKEAGLGFRAGVALEALESAVCWDPINRRDHSRHGNKRPKK